MTFGSASVGVIAIILLILQAINMVIEVIIIGFLLYRIYGWSIHMFWAILGSLKQCLILISRRSTDPRPTKSYNFQREDKLVQIRDQAQSLPSTASKTEQCVGSISTQDSEEKFKKHFFTYIPYNNQTLLDNGFLSRCKRSCTRFLQMGPVRVLSGPKKGSKGMQKLCDYRVLHRLEPGGTRP